MKKITAFLLFCFQLAFTQGIERLPGSPYPASSKPDTLYRITDKNYSAESLLTISTLQGLLAQTKPAIYRIENANYSIWLNDLAANYGVKVITAYDNNNLRGLLSQFKNRISSYVLCNLNDNSVNTAISLCGISNSIAVTSGFVTLMTSLGIPMLEDVRGKDEFWFFSKYGSQINKKAFCFQDESKASFLSDYSVFGKMLTFYNSSFTTSTDNIFRSFDKNAALFGWGFGESELVDHLSQFNIMTHAADWALNLSTLTNFNAKAVQPKAEPKADYRTNMHTVCFLMTDGDNLQWLVSTFMNAKWYGSTSRGKVNLGWTMSPAASELAPTLLKKIYDTEKITSLGRDYFVAAPSGVGYVFPERMPDLESYAALTSKYMEKADLRILNLIQNNISDKYLLPFMTKSNIDAIFYYPYANYAGVGGLIKWVGDKPVITGKYNLWYETNGAKFESPVTLADKMNAASTNIYSSAAYSLIPVHVWSQSVSDVVMCSKLLDSTVRVVAPDEFVSLIYRNLGPRSDVLSFVPGSTVESSFLLPEYAGTGADATHRWADDDKKIIYKFNVDDLLARSGGVWDVRLGVTVANEYVVSVAPDIDSTLTEIARWSTSPTYHMHTGANSKEVIVDLEPFIEKGWSEIYLILEDGIKDDAYGPTVTKISIKKQKNVDVKEETSAPSNFYLGNNYPNPFNPSTAITYSMGNAGHVTIDIFDILGRRLTRLVDGIQQKGVHIAYWNGINENGQQAASGILLCRMSCDGFSKTKKMMLLK